jgi:hypothetical protein
MNNNEAVETTVAQLNFFKWAIEKKVLDWYKANYSKVEKDMSNSNQKSKKKKSGELQKQAKRHNVNITVTFS